MDPSTIQALQAIADGADPAMALDIGALDEDDAKRYSKALSKVTRHTATLSGLKVTGDGYMPVDAVLRCPAFTKLP